MRLRAVIYARVSTAAQRDRDTISSQLSTLPTFVERMGWDLIRPPYVEDGISGAAPLADRRELGRLLADAGAGLFDIVAVVAIDRLSRSEDQIERAYVFGALQRSGVSIAESATGIVHQGGTFGGDATLALGTLLAVEERRRLRERTMRGKERAIAAGKKPAGPTPFGLRYDRETGIFTIDPVESALVREAFERIAAGESCVAVSTSWNVRGVATGPDDRANRATEWRNERVYNLVRSATYRGEWTIDKRRRLTLKVPAIVDEALWYRAGDALERWGRRGLRRTKHVYLCEAIADCAACGARIGISRHSYATVSQARVEHGYYICGHRRRPPFGGARCDLPMRRVDEVDERLWVAVLDVLTNRGAELADMIAERRVRAAAATSDWARDAAEYEERIGRLDRTERALLERFRRGKVSEGALDQELDAVGRERAFLRTQVEAARRAVAAGSASAQAGSGALAALRRLALRATPDQRRRIVRAIIPGDGEYRVRLGVQSIEAKGAIWETAPAVAHAERASSSTVGLSNEEFPLCVVELVA